MEKISGKGKAEREKNLSPEDKKKLNRIQTISLWLDRLILIFSVLLLLIASYALWDSNQVFQSGDRKEYAQYKPDPDDRYSYQEFRSMNENVIGWLEVYGTEIDYPVVQGEDNHRYLNETVFGEFSTAGSIFLDFRNKPDFSDPYSIIYGHHMAKNKMFGDLDLFEDPEFFETHPYGALQIGDEERKGITFFAFLHSTGTDREIFSMDLNIDDVRMNWFDKLPDQAVHFRKVPLDREDRIVILDTCDFSITDGRFFLVGKLTDKVEENPYANENKGLLAGFKLKSHLWLIPILIIALLLIYLYRSRKKKGKNEKDKE